MSARASEPSAAAVAMAQTTLNLAIEQIDHDSFWADSLTDEQWSKLCETLRPFLARALDAERQCVWANVLLEVERGHDLHTLKSLLRARAAEARRGATG
jgi:hypothetical protein